MNFKITKLTLDIKSFTQVLISIYRTITFIMRNKILKIRNVKQIRGTIQFTSTFGKTDYYTHNIKQQK